MKPHQKAAYLQLLTLNSLDEILSEFQLGNLLSGPNRNDGNNNSFFVETDNGKFQVKSYVKSEENPEYYATQVMREIAFTTFLFERKFLVQQHLSFQPFLYNGLVTTITSYLEGKTIQPSSSDHDIPQKLGKLIGELHLASCDFGKGGATFEQRNSFREKVSEQLANITAVVGVEERRINEIINTYNTLRQEKSEVASELPKGLIHNEITPHHVLKGAENDLLLIDFEGTKFTLLVADFGQTFQTFFYTENEGYNTQQVRSFLKSYETVRELSEREYSWLGQELRYNYYHKLEWRMLAMLSNEGYIPIVKTMIENMDRFEEQVAELRKELPR
ncbi:MAG: phosphotransferase [Candidatus Dojkabacteria bacterium]|nr:MAG: phosphotransferase [Candidatus Dojkabacteria bacterium]